MDNGLLVIDFFVVQDYIYVQFLLLSLIFSLVYEVFLLVGDICFDMFCFIFDGLNMSFDDIVDGNDVDELVVLFYRDVVCMLCIYELYEIIDSYVFGVVIYI